MAEGEWYYTQEGRQLGPISFYQLQQLANSGTLKTTDYVWTNGQADWKPASEIAGLFAGGNPVSSPPNHTYGSAGSSDLVLPSDPPRDPAVMAILSAVVPGLGQLVLGQTVKGIVLFVLAIGLFRIFCIGSLAVSIVAIIDAYQIATKLKNRQPVRQWDFF